MRRLLFTFFFVTSLTLSAAEPAPVNDVELINQDGQSFRLHSLKGNWVLLSFLYTQCPLPTMCPLNMQLSKRLLSEWKTMRNVKHYPLKIVGVTLDPARDTPAALKKFGEGYQISFERMILATGEPQKLDDFASQFNAIGLPAPDGTIAHSMRTILLNPKMIPVVEYKDNAWAPADVLTHMKKSTPWWKIYWPWLLIALGLLLGPLVVLYFLTRKKNKLATA